MAGVLANRVYRRLFLAQAVALAGTGLATVALALLAFELAGANAGRVLATALAIKMGAYIGVSLIAGALADRLPRRGFLVTLDLIRAGLVLTLPFVTEIWQIYLLIFLLQSASAGFTPAFQALIPAVLPAEKDYTRALALTRMAYDLESLFSPMLAAALLTLMSFHGLFAGTALGFAISALALLGTRLPNIPRGPRPGGPRPWRGIGIYLQTPRLRGLLAVTLAAAAGGALVIVHTVALVQAVLGLPERAYALTLAAFGAGAMLTALLLPALLDRISERNIMLGGAALTTAALGGLGGYLATGGALSWGLMLGVWFLLGMLNSAMLTPAGRLRARSRPRRPLCRAIFTESRLLAARLSAHGRDRRRRRIPAGHCRRGPAGAGRLPGRRRPVAAPKRYAPRPPTPRPARRPPPPAPGPPGGRPRASLYHRRSAPALAALNARPGQGARRPATGDRHDRA